MLPLHPDHMLKMFHTEQKELLLVVGRRPLYGTPAKLNGARTQKISGARITKGNGVHTMKRTLLAARRILPRSVPPGHSAGPECCTP
ncbi:hypothetical protein GCM10027402_07730 [Arthrobacter monumenti]